MNGQMKLAALFLCQALGMVLGGHARAAEEMMIENGTVRVQAVRRGEGVVLRFDARRPGESWRTVLSTAAQTKGAPWVRREETVIEDIEIDATGADLP